jgi:hypothetical protein
MKKLKEAKPNSEDVVALGFFLAEQDERELEGVYICVTLKEEVDRVESEMGLPIRL